jgi:hypothetical protein
MNLTRWNQPNRSKSRRPASFRPSLSQLDQRDLPSATPATHFLLSEPAFVQADKTFNLTVTAETASNRPATGFNGTVQFSTLLPDAGAVGLDDYTFTPSDHGTHTFKVTLTEPEQTQAIVAMDGNLVGMATNSVAPSPVATQLIVSLPNHVTAGTPTTVTVTALDQSGRKVPGYTGTVDFSSTDPAMTGTDLPSEYTFQASDNGTATFQVTFRTPSTTMATTLSVTDGSILSSATPIVNGAVSVTVTHFSVFEVTSATQNSPAIFTVVALDVKNHIVTNYTGTVHLASSDPSAILPADYTFQAGDRGSHQFAVTFESTGRQSLIASDASAGAMGADAFQVSGKHSSWWWWW